ncbi:F-box kelch-repeat protein [Musa troglodytarum]|uniref:F-box kelch-repeat protein n=1 Tax=Musa troglodytarum TaxID=320322 RepID=A0A9E7H993_9LILI|nr:F-box kelch-repeat protein [Musa troglodytarum]
MDEMGELGFQSARNCIFGDDDPPKHLILSTRPGSRNTSPSRQKVIKTKPRGFDEETIATFTKVVHADIQMEDSIWALLPEDLLMEVLARVPPFLIFRLRSVCRRWNSILHDCSFLASHSQVPSHGPCLLTFWKNSQAHQCSVFSLPLKTWYKIPFVFLPDWAFWLVGSSGGLVCFSGYDGLSFRMLVCNPLTQTWRVLPGMHYNQQRQLILVTDKVDRSFKVIATSDIYGNRTLPTEVYDSKLDSWSVHQVMPAVNLCSSKMAFCDSRLYLETLSPLGLMMYRVDTGQWEHIPAKFPRSLLDGYLVAGAQKRLFLVGRIGLYSTLQSMRIWELDHAKTIRKHGLGLQAVRSNYATVSIAVRSLAAPGQTVPKWFRFACHDMFSVVRSSPQNVNHLSPLEPPEWHHGGWGFGVLRDLYEVATWLTLSRRFLPDYHYLREIAVSGSILIDRLNRGLVSPARSCFGGRNTTLEDKDGWPWLAK